MRDKIVEKFVKHKSNLVYKGKLVIDREKDNEWGKLELPNSLRNERAEKHLVVTSLWTTPPYKAHISVFSKEEAKQLPEDFEWEGKEFTFTLSDNCRILDPEGWDEVYECAIEPVECLELEKLRMSLGFDPLMYGHHEFHLTLGIRYEKDREKHEGKNRRAWRSH